MTRPNLVAVARGEPRVGLAGEPVPDTALPAVISVVFRLSPAPFATFLPRSGCR